MSKRKTNSEDRASQRTKAWAVIVYPESVCEGWRDALDGQHIPWVESPLHDADLNADDTEKKAHWHVLFLFGSMKTYDQVVDITKDIGSTKPIKVSNVRGMVRYFAHLDNPEKKQYNANEIVTHCGADVLRHLVDEKESRRRVVREMRHWVHENECLDFATLFDYACDEEEEWFDCLITNGTYVMEKYINSRWKIINARIDKAYRDAKVKTQS